MTALMNFDPFIDYESVNEEMAADLHQAMRAQREAAQDFVSDDEPDLAKAAKFLEITNDVNSTVGAIMETLYTLPVMVHVAGERKEENNPDDESEQGVVQRCKRCGSVLHFWREGIAIFTPEGPRMLQEDDVPWWEEGTLVAKGQSDSTLAMYEIEEKRELEKHERECLDMNSLVGD